MKCIKYPSGTKEWYFNDKLHRLDGPAVEYPHGMRKWYLDGKLHRVDGPAYEYPTGAGSWYLNGKRHRVEGPALEEWNGTKKWFLNGKLHRVDGPAIEYSTGTKEWYLGGREFKEFEYASRLKIREFRSKIAIFSHALESNFSQTLKLSQRQPVIEWYYSPDNGGGKLAKKRIEQFIGSTNPL